MAKSPRTGQNRGRRAAERRPPAEEPVAPGASPSVADDYSRVIAAVEATRQDGLTREQIATRAYEIYVARGGSHGYDIEDWLQAERELRRK
jgi:ribosome-binding protein aMBF1 (putative translation factor)